MAEIFDQREIETAGITDHQMTEVDNLVKVSADLIDEIGNCSSTNSESTPVTNDQTSDTPLNNSNQAYQSFNASDDEINDHTHSPNERDEATTVVSADKKKGGRPKGAKSNLIFLEAKKLRTKRAKTSAISLIKKVKTFEETCGGKAFLHLEYETAKEPLTWTYGDYLGNSSELRNEPNVAVVDTVDEGQQTSQVTNDSQENEESTEAQSQVEQPHFSGSITTPIVYSSPMKLTVSITSDDQPTGYCYVCQKDKILVATNTYQSEWIGCDYQNCRAYVHADCIGFPLVTKAQIKDMPSHYCRFHAQVIREQNETTPKGRKGRPKRM